MKKLLATLIAALALLSVSAMAADPIMPDWMEKFKPGDSYSYGEYSTVRGVAENTFSPETLNGQLILDTNSGDASVSQTATTSVLAGHQQGIDRQLLGQSGSAFVAINGGVVYWDPEVDSAAVPQVFGVSKDQYASFSGRLVPTQTIQGVLADANGEVPVGQLTDDPYDGDHQMLYQEAPAWTATFSDVASVGTGGVTLHEATDGAAVTISQDPAKYWEILDPACSGYPANDALTGENSNDLATWKLDGTQGSTATKVGKGALTEVYAGTSSDATLTQHVVGTLTGQTTYWTMDGSASLDGAFQDALTDAGTKIAINLNTADNPFDSWWSTP